MDLEDGMGNVPCPPTGLLKGGGCLSLPALVFTLVAAIFLFRLPRRWAPLPLLIGASYMTLGQAIEVGPLDFTVLRILILVGVCRVFSRGESIQGGMNNLDRVIVAWAIWGVVSSFFHEEVASTLIFRLGLAFNAVGLYYLCRVFIQTTEDVSRLGQAVIIVLVPIAIEMFFEASTCRNLFSVFGGVSEYCSVREGRIRAQGPFAHSILAGTVGAVCLPMALLLWKKNRRLSLIGLAATGGMVLFSQSSGPIMSAFFVVLGLFLWKYKQHMQAIRWSGVVGILALSLVMNAPVYYLIARIDLTGSSTGWHRAILIESAIKDIGEWWLGGTDYTRDWTPNPGFNEKETDITNHYIRMAVWGGLPMMVLFISAIVMAFGTVGRALRCFEHTVSDERFLIWTLGCILFGHTATMMSVSYFDQSVVFLYLVLATISSVGAEASLGIQVSNEASQLDGGNTAEATVSYG